MLLAPLGVGRAGRAAEPCLRALEYETQVKRWVLLFDEQVLRSVARHKVAFGFDDYSVGEYEVGRIVFHRRRVGYTPWLVFHFDVAGLEQIQIKFLQTRAISRLFVAVDFFEVY